jgi:hypothetical protein
VNTYYLGKGQHSEGDGRCAMEWVAYLAGEPHSDSPVCVSPVLRSFGISLNDNWDDEQRQKLRPYLARCIGTAGDGRDEERGWLAMDWLIRVYTPRFMDLRPELSGHAEKLRSLSPVLAPLALDDAMIVLKEARYVARVAAGDAAGDAAWDAAGLAARVAAGLAAQVAARVAAWDAARVAAWDAARVAAWDAARVAAGLAAWDAARDALQKAVTDLQVSALDLFDRMLPKEIVEIPSVGMAEAEMVCGVTFERNA